MPRRVWGRPPWSITTPREFVVDDSGVRSLLDGLLQHVPVDALYWSTDHDQEIPGYLSQVRWQVRTAAGPRVRVHYAGVPSDQLLEMARTAELLVRTREAPCNSPLVLRVGGGDLRLLSNAKARRRQFMTAGRHFRAAVGEHDEEPWTLLPQVGDMEKDLQSALQVKPQDLDAQTASQHPNPQTQTQTQPEFEASEETCPTPESHPAVEECDSPQQPAEEADGHRRELASSEAEDGGVRVMTGRLTVSISPMAGGGGCQAEDVQVGLVASVVAEFERHLSQVAPPTEESAPPCDDLPKAKSLPSAMKKGGERKRPLKKSVSFDNKVVLVPSNTLLSAPPPLPMRPPPRAPFRSVPICLSWGH